MCTKIDYFALLEKQTLIIDLIFKKYHQNSTARILLKNNGKQEFLDFLNLIWWKKERFYYMYKY